MSSCDVYRNCHLQLRFTVICYQTNILVDTQVTEGCVCVAPGYSQFTSSMSRFANSVFIHCVPQPTTCKIPSKPRKPNVIFTRVCKMVKSSC